MIRSHARAPQSLLALGCCVALLACAGVASAQAPVVTYVYPPDNADHVGVNAVIVFAFDRPTGKHAAYSLADFDPSAGGGLISTAPDRWSPLGDTLYVTPLSPLAFGHLFGMKLNVVQDTAGVAYSNPAYYPEVHYFTTAALARVERVQAGNVNLSLTPDVTLPVGIPVRELAGTAVGFTSARVQFLSSDLIPNDGTIGLDLSVAPLYQYTVPLGTMLPRAGTANLLAPVRLPESVARNIPQGQMGVRLTFYGSDETGTSVVVDAVFRLNPTTNQAHPGSVLPAIAGVFLVRTAVLEWPTHGTVIAAGDTLMPRAVVTGNGTGTFRCAFYLDGEPVAMEEGHMEAGLPVTITPRGPIPVRRFGEHRLQFVVESPQPLAANPISIICAPPPSGVSAPKPDLFKKEEPPPATPKISKLRGSTTWLAEGSTKFREEDHSATGWGSWNGVYEISTSRKIEAEASARVRLDDLGNGAGTPQHLLVRYSDFKRTLTYGDTPMADASDTPLLMSAVPRRSAQLQWRGTPIGMVEGYAALSSRPLSVAGDARRVSDLYAGRLVKYLFNDRLTATLYGGYTHEGGRHEVLPAAFDSGQTFVQVNDIFVQRKVIYGGMALIRLPKAWHFTLDAATVHHRARPDSTLLLPLQSDRSGKSRTAWRADLSGSVAGFAAQTQGFSYQPDLVTALNPYALENRRGGFAQLERTVFENKYTLTGSFRSEEPAHVEGQEPTVRVQTGTFSTRVVMNQDSWVTPYYVHVRSKGANTDFTEQRIGGDYTASEAQGGRTTARFNIAFLNDLLRAGTRRRVTSGSLVTVRKHPGRVTSTTILGLEQNKSQDLNRTDTTVQGSFEARWEAVQGRLLVIPYVSGVTRHLELFGTKEDRYMARLQVAFLRVPGFGENAVAIEGRLDRIQHLEPSRAMNLNGSVQLTVGQRFSLPNL